MTEIKINDKEATKGVGKGGLLFAAGGRVIWYSYSANQGEDDLKD